MKAKRIRHPVLIVLVAVIGLYTAYLIVHDERDLPPLQDGDIVFQTTWTNQSMAIGIATLSVYIHTGIVKSQPDGFYVIEAANPVRETPLLAWIHGGILERFSVYRYLNIKPEQGARIVKAAEHYLGEPYNFYFSFEKGSMYCSELVWQAYKDAGMEVGTVEKIGQLQINNRFTREIIEQRWHHYPACRSTGMTFDQCYKHIMNGPIITPTSLAHDPHLVRIFDNYPW